VNLPDFLTDPAFLAAMAALATVLATSGRPFLAAALKAVVSFLSKQNPQPVPVLAEVDLEHQCTVLKCIRHKFSEATDATARSANLELCDKLEAALKPEAE
jgi:hypothetical protein